MELCTLERRLFLEFLARMKLFVNNYNFILCLLKNSTVKCYYDNFIFALKIIIINVKTEQRINQFLVLCIYIFSRFLLHTENSRQMYNITLETSSENVLAVVLMSTTNIKRRR